MFGHGANGYVVDSRLRTVDGLSAFPPEAQAAGGLLSAVDAHGIMEIVKEKLSRRMVTADSQRLTQFIDGLDLDFDRQPACILRAAATAGAMPPQASM
jgi:hypothetical protein